ncbi:hypothetical protein [Agrobacterium rosae]|uniref:Uncharacterized protein n=1 Tax=Agrobacterium rosae TaxID=1972867 RepID=A0A1R3TZP2_9HYPH|nr:hypothetical protein [Agrobacterium rosae]SCX29774.1 hypothetical protein DSM25559_3418 [Agrobacterium rosae]
MTPELVTLIAAAVAAVAAIAAAVVSGFGVYIQSRTVSKMKIAEYRREWVEELRRNIVEFIAGKVSAKEAKRLRDVARTKGDDNEANKQHENYLVAIQRMGKSYVFIRLCLNPNEELHVELENVLDLVQNGTDAEIDAGIKKLGFSLTEKSRQVLKAEWDRLKKES